MQVTGPALERLAQQVEAAAREIERLRAANRALAARLEALDPPADSMDDLRAFRDALGAGTPDELRTRITRYLGALDYVLDPPPPEPPAATP